MVATPLHVVDNIKSDFSAPQEIPDDCSESNTMSSEAVSVNTLAAFLIGSRSQAYSHRGRSEQSASPRTASFLRKRQEEASLLRQREEETGAEITALNQFIFQAGNLYRGQRLTKDEEAQLHDAAEHVGLSMEVVNVLLRHMADPNAMVNYCLRSDDGFARKFKDDPNFTCMMEEGSLSGGFDLSSSVWRVFLLRIVQQFLKEHDMELGDVMYTSSLTNQTYDEALKNGAEKSEYNNRFAQFSNSMRDFTEERKHVSIDSEEAKKARLQEAQVTSTAAPHPTFREVLEQGDSSSHIRQPLPVRETSQGDSSSHIRQPLPVRETSHHALHTESRDDDLDSRPGRFQSDELSEAPRTSLSISGASELGGRHTSMGRQMPEEEENGAQVTESSENSDERQVSAVKRGLAMFGKGASSTGTSPQSKRGAVKRTKSTSRLSSARAIFEKSSQGTEQEVQSGAVKSCGSVFKSSSKRWPKKAQESQFDSSKSVGPEFKAPSKWSRKVQETECESKSVGPEFKSPSKWPKKVDEAQFDSAKTIGSEFNEPSKWSNTVEEAQFGSAESTGSEFKLPDFATANPKSPFGSKGRNAMQMFGPSRINEQQGQSNAVPNNRVGENENSASVAYHHVQYGPEDPIIGERGAEDAKLGSEHFKNADAQSTRKSDASEHGYEDPSQRFTDGYSMPKYPASHGDASSSEAPMEGVGPLHRKPDAVDTASGVDEVQAIYSSFTRSSDLSDDDFIHSSRSEADTKAFRPRTLANKNQRRQRTASARTSTRRSSPQSSNNRSYKGTHKHDSKNSGFAQDGNILPEQDTRNRNEVGTKTASQDTESSNEVATRTASQGWTNFKSNNAMPTYGRHRSFGREADKHVDPFTGGSRYENASQGISGLQSRSSGRAEWTDPLPRSPAWHGSGIHALESKPIPNASFGLGSFQDTVDNAEVKRIRMIELQLKQQWNDTQAKAFTGVQEFSGVATPTAATVITNASSIDGWVPFESRKQKSKDAGFDPRRWDDNLKEPSVENPSSGSDGIFPSDEGSYDNYKPGRRQRSSISQIRAPAAATDGEWARFEGSSLPTSDSKGYTGGEAEWKNFGSQAQDKSETEKIASQDGNTKVLERINGWGKHGVDATPKGEEKLAHGVSQVISEGRDNGRMQPLNPTELIGESYYGREDFSVANSSTVHRHANPHQREPLHQEEWSSLRDQPSHIKALSENKGRQATIPEQNREEPPPNEPGGTYGNATNQHAYPNSEYQSEWNHAPMEKKKAFKGSFDLDEVCKSRSTDPAGIKPQLSENTDKTDAFSAGSDSLDRYKTIRMDKPGSVQHNISGRGVLEFRSISNAHNQNPLPSHSIQGKRDHSNAQQKRHYQSKESTIHARSETPATYPATEQAYSLGDWSPGHWENEENRNIKRLRTDENSQSRASSLKESDFGLNSIDIIRDERSQESDVSGLNPIQATGTQTTQSSSPGSDFNAMNFYEPTNGQPESAFRPEQKDKPAVHRKELKESSLFTNSGKDPKANYVHGSDRDGPDIKKGFHHSKSGRNRSNRVEAHFSRISKNEVPVQETPQEYYGRGIMENSNPAEESSFPNQRIPELHGERDVQNVRPTQPTSEGRNLYDQHSSVFHHTAPPSYNVGTTAALAFAHHRDDGSQTHDVLRVGCEEGKGACGGLIETSHRPLNGRALAQPDIEWIAFEKDHADRSNSHKAQPARSAKADFDALNAFLDEFQYDGKPLKSTRHGPPPDLVENRSSSTLSAILGVSTDHEGKVEAHDLERTRRREDNAPRQVVYPNRNQQLNSESDLEDIGRKDKYANVNSTSELTSSGSDRSIDEAEVRAAATLSGIPLDVVDVILAQAKRSQPDVPIPVSSRNRLEKGQLFSSEGSIYVPDRKTEYQVIVGEVVNRKTGYQVIVGEVVDDKKGGDKRMNPSTKSWETAEAMDDCNFGTPRAASTHPVGVPSLCMPEGKTPVRRDASPTHFRSPKEDVSEDQEPEGATEEEIELLNRFIEVAASNFNGKRLSADSETRVRAAALKVGLSEVFVDQLIQQANDENSKSNKQFEPQSTRSYVQKCLRTPNTQASRSFEITRAETEARKANAAAETTMFASGCQVWESLTQNLTYWTKPITTCGDVSDDASSVGLMSAPTLSWEEDASKQQHPPQRTPAQNDGRRGYV